MIEINTLQWQQIVYGKHNELIPQQRWGHRMVQTNKNQLVMFGGFGSTSSEGKYLNDTWLFDLNTYSWLKIETTGTVPQSRSNYTIHYNSVNNQILLFGGGSQNKARFNTICILDWTKKVWRSVVTSQTDPSPFQRTYHSSEFIYPYLIIFGGESVSNLDLDDMWTFNIINQKWNKIQFKENGVHPKRRRFHSSALLNGHFYVIGGCTENYELLGDMYRVDLSSLIQHGTLQGFTWERLIPYNRLLERWGHSSEVFEGKIYCFGGRISSTSDNNDIYVYDPCALTLKAVAVNSQKIPKPRRRHASSMVGNSLVIFGGYDGKYLRDFHYIRIRTEKKIIPKQIDLIILDCMAQVNSLISDLESTMNYSLSIALYKNGKPLTIIGSSKQLLQANPFFKNIAIYSRNTDILQVQLPSFCDQLTFRVIHLAILDRQLVISRLSKVQFFNKLLESIEYFSVKELTCVIEDYLVGITEQHNCHELLNCSILASLPLLKAKAAETFLSMHQYPFNKHTLRQLQSSNEKNIQHQPSPQDFIKLTKKTSSKLTLAKMDILNSIYKLIRLDLDQTRMRQNQINFLQKTSKKIKKFFSKKQESTKTEAILDQKVSSTSQSGCVSKFIGFISGMCTRRETQHQHN